jgi:hypothetical protein
MPKRIALEFVIVSSFDIRASSFYRYAAPRVNLSEEQVRSRSTERSDSALKDRFDTHGPAFVLLRICAVVAAVLALRLRRLSFLQALKP